MLCVLSEGMDGLRMLETVSVAREHHRDGNAWPDFA